MAQFSAAPDSPSMSTYADGNAQADPSIPAGYSERLYNEDLAPLENQTWGAYNIFAFWMSDVHSVGGYVFAGSLFALGLTSWQVLVALLVGIGLVNAAVQHDRQAEPGDRRAVSGRVPRDVRRARREYSRGDSRADRGRVVRHPDLSGLERAGDRRAQVRAVAAALCRRSSTRLRRVCRRSAGRASCCCGCCRRWCSGMAWK